MPDRQVSTNKEVFDKAEPEYERIYFDQTTGGFVLLHTGHNRGESLESELFIAKVFAKNGGRVKLLDGSEQIEGKRPDAEIWDFKKLTAEVVGFTNRIQAGIREARKQGAVKVAYHIAMKDFNLEKGMRSAFEFDKLKQLQQVFLVFQDGSLDFYNPSELGI